PTGRSSARAKPRPGDCRSISRRSSRTRAATRAPPRRWSARAGRSCRPARWGSSDRRRAIRCWPKRSSPKCTWSSNSWGWAPSRPARDRVHLTSALRAESRPARARLGRTMKKMVAILLAALAAGLSAQEQGIPTFREAVEVRVMDLDVSVTDSRGRPLSDLTQGVSSVRVDGRVVRFDSCAGREGGTTPAPARATAPRGGVLAEYRRGGGAYVPRHFLIYMDVGHLAPNNRSRALEALRDLV